MIIWILVLIWLLIHLNIALFSSRLKKRTIESINVWFDPLPFERSLRLYKLLGVKKWKNIIPDAAGLFPNSMSKANIGVLTSFGRKRFILETKRAELSHWLQILPSPIFFLLNDPFIGVMMIVYAIAFNTPMIIVQRYNRFRLMRLKERHHKHDLFIYKGRSSKM